MPSEVIGQRAQALGGATVTLTYLEAIREAMREEMRRDEDVILMGEDIGVYGGAFKVTKGLFEEFGPDRVIDTPLAEAGFTGAAIGAALMGMRPVVEFQFADFISCAFDQITNFAAKTHYRLGNAVPIVFRAPYGGGIHGGPFHSQCPEMYFVHTPGLKVVAPSTAYDAKGLMKSAIRDPNPVLYLEHKFLYRRVKEELSVDDYIVPIGKAAIRTRGDSLTLLSYGAMMPVSLDAARRFDGAVEVIDLRTLLPLDLETIITSVQHTNKVLIVHEDTRTGGIAGELTSLIVEHAFVYLDGPIRRVTAPDSPVPYSPPLEQYYMPNAEDIASAIEELLTY
jgi:2-oxoisovalerate dehydrogenase E1 component beta subunit